jgi:transposase
MKYYTGLDVSVKETSVCIVDEKGKMCREKKVVSHPDDLGSFLSDPQWHLERVGLEAGPLSQWLYEGLAKAGFPAICIERAGSVCLNSFRRFAKWISASIMPPPSLVPAR